MKKTLFSACLYLTALSVAHAYDPRDSLRLHIGPGGSLSDRPDGFHRSLPQRLDYANQPLTVVREFAHAPDSPAEFLSWQHERLRFVFSLADGVARRAGEISIFTESTTTPRDFEEQRRKFLSHLQEASRTRPEIAALLSPFDLDRMLAQPWDDVKVEGGYAGLSLFISWHRAGARLILRPATGEISAYNQDGLTLDRSRNVGEFLSQIREQSARDERLQKLVREHPALAALLAR